MTSMPIAYPQPVSRGAWIGRHWLGVFNVAFGAFVLLPFAAPVLMALNAQSLARVLYFVYSFVCHQLPERSWFLFGPNFTFPLARFVELTGSANPLVLREFIGNAEMGFKVAWSDRMVSLYSSFWAGSLIYAALRRRIRPLAFVPFILLLVPLAVDGLTHMVSDIQGLGMGFRDTNAWLSALTNAALRPDFYAGDAWGSFNSVMRLATGVAAGLGVAWLVLPRLDSLVGGIAPQQPNRQPQGKTHGGAYGNRNKQPDGLNRHHHD